MHIWRCKLFPLSTFSNGSHNYIFSLIRTFICSHKPSLFLYKLACWTTSRSKFPGYVYIFHLIQTKLRNLLRM